MSKASCTLCPHECHLADGEVGRCRVRAASRGKVDGLTWGMISTMEVGPIEDKQLFHFMPGATVLSVGGSGCTLSCKFCQNHQISQRKTSDLFMFPAGVVREAIREGARAIAFTYAEPVVWREFVLDVAKEARSAGLATILKTNGFANPEGFAEIAAAMSAINMDIKGDQETYSEVCGVDMPEDPEFWVIMRNLEAANKRWAEVSIPVLPGRLGGLERVFAAMSHAAPPGMPVHLLRVMPSWRWKLVTSDSDLDAAWQVAQKYFRHVYVEGVRQDTACCGQPVIRRQWAKVIENNLVNGRCPLCDRRVVIV